MNQVDLPDPVAVELECLRRRVIQLEKIIRQMDFVQKGLSREDELCKICEDCSEECREDIKR